MFVKDSNTQINILLLKGINVISYVYIFQNVNLVTEF